MLSRFKEAFGDYDALGTFSTSLCFSFSSATSMLGFVVADAFYGCFNESVVGGSEGPRSRNGSKMPP